MEAVVDEAAQGVLVLFVVCGGLRDAGRFAEAVSGGLGAGDHPGEDAGAFFGDEALGEAFDALFFGDGVFEWD